MTCITSLPCWVDFLVLGAYGLGSNKMTWALELHADDEWLWRRFSLCTEGTWRGWLFLSSRSQKTEGIHCHCSKQEHKCRLAQCGCNCVMPPEQTKTDISTLKPLPWRPECVLGVNRVWSAKWYLAHIFPRRSIQNGCSISEHFTSVIMRHQEFPGIRSAGPTKDILCLVKTGHLFYRIPYWLYGTKLALLTLGHKARIFF